MKKEFIKREPFSYDENILERELEKIDTEADVPCDERQRQLYFIKKTRQIVKKKEREKGRKLFFDTITFGCQMNMESKIKTREKSGHMFCFLPFFIIYRLIF